MRPRRSPALPPAAAVLAGVTLCCFTSACSRSPIQADAPRSPYERYEVLRGTAPPKTVTDSFGKEQPNLRGRLERDGP